MKKIYRISAALLAATVAFSACAALVGCGDETGGAEVTAAPEVTDIAETAAEPETTAMTEPELPPADFEGYEFRFVLQDDGHGEWKGRELGEGEQTGDTLNDALYERDLKVSELYSVSLKPLFTGDLVRLLKNTVTAGDNACDALFIQAPQLTAPAMNGLLFDIKQVPGINLENPWWDAYAAKTLSIGGRLFFTYGDMNICDKDLTWLVMFNKKIAESYGIGNLYAEVADGKWTFDLFRGKCAGVYNDLNGDGEVNDDDLFGLVTPYDRTMLAFLYSCGVETIKKDDGDLPVYAMDSPKLAEVFSRVLSLYFDGGCALDVMRVSGYWRRTETMFSSNQILFYVECMQNVERMRAMQDDFGILPVPKYDESQGEYINMVCDFATAVCVPASAPDPARTGAVLEAMNAYSKMLVMPAYYEVSLKTKYARDNDSAEMIDLIFGRRYFDLAYIYQWGGSIGAVMKLAGKGDENVVSKLESLREKTEAAIQKTVEAYIG